MPGLTHDMTAPLRLHSLTYLEEGDDVTIGRTDIDSYGLFPREGADVVRRLENGEAPATVASWFESEHGEPLDIADLIEILEDLRFVATADEEISAPGRVRWQRLGQVIFSKPAAAIWASVVAWALITMARTPALAPRYQNLFFSRVSLTVIMLGSVLAQVPLMLLHESAHALAGRRLGLNSSLSIGRRLYYVVFLTSLDGLVGVPRRKRYLPMLAGILLDTFAIATLTVLGAALHQHHGAPGFVGRYLLAAAFGTWVRLVWQLYFFLRTDIYYLVSTALGCNDLQRAARHLLTSFLRRIVGLAQKPSPAEFTERDGQVARWYVWLMVAGYGFLLASVPLFMAPTAIRITRLGLHELISAPSPLRVADVCTFLFLNFLDFIIAGGLAVRSLLLRSAKGPINA